MKEIVQVTATYTVTYDNPAHRKDALREVRDLPLESVTCSSEGGIGTYKVKRRRVGKVTVLKRS